MNEKDHQTAMSTAQLSESVGMLLCLAGVMIGFAAFSSGFHQGFYGIAVGTSMLLPSLGIGFLLIVAARILRAVSGGARSPE